MDKEYKTLLDDLFSVMNMQDRPANSLWDLCSACLGIKKSLEAFTVLSKDLDNEEKHFQYILHRNFTWSLGNVIHNEDVPLDMRLHLNKLWKLAHFITNKFEKEVFHKKNKQEFYCSKITEALLVMYQECLDILIEEIKRWNLIPQLNSFPKENLSHYVIHILDHKGKKDNDCTKDLVPFFIDTCKKYVM